MRLPVKFIFYERGKNGVVVILCTSKKSISCTLHRLHTLFIFNSFFSMLKINCLFQLQASHEQIIAPLERFRKENIGGVKEGKKKFEKQTAKFCQSQERYLNLSIKKLDSQIKEVSCCEKSSFFSGLVRWGSLWKCQT